MDLWPHAAVGAPPHIYSRPNLWFIEPFLPQMGGAAHPPPADAARAARGPHLPPGQGRHGHAQAATHTVLVRAAAW